MSPNVTKICWPLDDEGVDLFHCRWNLFHSKVSPICVNFI